VTDTFFWYDLETFGRDPRRTRIAQFAGVRTDTELNPIGDPVSLFCKPADDLLPSPEATLITGITPQRALREGLREAELFARVFDELAQPGTCALGYNSIRFDDEFIRYGLYRNFYDPYEREWRNGNSRWDLLDFMRLAHALRPEGLSWPKREDGTTSFKLEDLADANGVRTGTAHEALSDVRALIGLARKIRAAQPRLWDYHYAQRDKKKVAALLDVVNMTPLLHISGRYPAARMCAALVVPLTRHPRIDTRTIVLDLDADPQPLIDLSAEDIADRLYTPAADLPEGEARIPLKEVHGNRCPVLVPLDFLRAADFERLGIDHATALARAERLRSEARLAEKVRQIYAMEKHREPADADAALYDGFPSDSDKRIFPIARSTAPEKLSSLESKFADPRYRELLFRYRARNWPDSLDSAELERWNDYRRVRLQHDDRLSEYSFATYFEEILALRAHHGPGDAQALLDSLQAWGKELQRQLL
jgi:exodeoxyribonuclease-1